MGGEHLVVHLLAGKQLGQDVPHLLAHLEEADVAGFGGDIGASHRLQNPF
jgi:hypothetical protein